MASADSGAARESGVVLAVGRLPRRRFGVPFDVIGGSDAFSVPVHLGITPCTRALLEAQRAALGLSGPLLSAPPVPALAVAA